MSTKIDDGGGAQPAKLGISALVAAIGDENIEVENVGANATFIQRKKDCTAITFNTSHANGQEQIAYAFEMKPKRIGLVLWFDADKLPEESK